MKCRGKMNRTEKESRYKVDLRAAAFADDHSMTVRALVIRGKPRLRNEREKWWEIGMSTSRDENRWEEAVGRSEISPDKEP